MNACSIAKIDDGTPPPSPKTDRRQKAGESKFSFTLVGICVSQCTISGPSKAVDWVVGTALKRPAFHSHPASEAVVSQL